MADQFTNFNRLAERTQRHPMMSAEELTARFKEIDRLLRLATRTLLASTHFVEDNLCYRLAEIASGSIKTKIYRGRLETARHHVGHGVSVGAENNKILSLGFDLFKLSRTARDVAAPLSLRVMRSLRLQNITYEQIVRSFVDLTKDYCSTCEVLAVEQQQLKEAENTGADLVERVERISNLIDFKRQAENRVGSVEPNMLYGTVALVRRYAACIDKIQEQIVRSYLRSVPRIVREYAQSDLDALDAFQAGCFGLLHAIRAYDYRSRAGFIGFARHWIRQRIRGAMKESTGPLIRLPPSVYEDFYAVRRIRLKLKEQNGMDPTRAEIAEEMGCSVDKVDQVLERISVSQVSSLEDEQQVDNEYMEREATIADVRGEENEQWMAQRAHVTNLVEPLDSEDRRLICLFHGCVDLIENEQLDPFQRVEEILRQFACKTLMQTYVAGRIDTVQSEIMEENDR